MIKNFSTLVEVSARHIHLSENDLTKLFGKNFKLKPLRPVSQPNQYAAYKTVNILGPKGTLSNVRIVGPTRPKTQLEISITDSFKLGITAMLRTSGDLRGTKGGVQLVGPRGSVKIKNGVIIARRHLHIQPALAKKYGLKHMDRVSVHIPGKRSVVFNQVVVRSRENIDSLSFQIDTDEGNAAGIKGKGRGTVHVGSEL
ncbi:phosphate propanoyltransferase [Patescibacteria group bacterium]|nr:phosphate propanoyltransferase [Patescibacteria group bacterium]MBU1889883.1 phosphate propanoyltransferase [Patescibacteria group bacterium]